MILIGKELTLTLTRTLTPTLLLTTLLALSLYWVYHQRKNGNQSRRPLLTQIGAFLGACLLATLFLGGTLAGGENLALIGVTLALGLSGLSGVLTVPASATAAIQAISENEGAFGRAIIFVALAEGAALYGLIVAFLILML